MNFRRLPSGVARPLAHPATWAAAVALLAPLATARASTLEDWNSGAAQNHNWSYWQKLTGDLEADQPAIWSAAGGVGDTGHISAPLADLTLTQNGYWAAYLFSALPAQQINLATDPQLRVSLKLDSGSDLGGGTVRFFIGEFINADNQVFFAYDSFLATNDDWMDNDILLDSDPGSWLEVIRVGSAKQPVDLFANPQQFGFMIEGVTTPGDLAGTLRVDNFQVVPEPAGLAGATVGLLALGWVCLRRRAHSRVLG